MEGLSHMNKVEVLYEDNHIIVVVKPVNVLSQGDATSDLDLLTMVKNYVKEKYHKKGNVYIGLVHRLDRPVGGVMVFARSSKAASRLSDAIRTHQLKKRYLAIVHGKIESSGTFTDYLKKDTNYNTHVVSEKEGKFAKLNYRVLAYDASRDLSLVDIDLETGRHHQIRVQFASRGYPLYGDQRYGKLSKEDIALYAYELSFVHPVKKELMVFRNLPQNTGAWRYFELKKIVDNGN